MINLSTSDEEAALTASGLVRNLETPDQSINPKAHNIDIKYKDVYFHSPTSGKQTFGVSGLPNGDKSSEFSLSDELLRRFWANFLFNASAMRAAGSPRDAEMPVLRLLLTGVPPGDLKTQCRKKEKLF